MSQLQREVENSIADFCTEVVTNPLIYFSESDLQQLLVEELRKINTLKKKYSTAVGLGKDSKGK